MPVPPTPSRVLKRDLSALPKMAAFEHFVIDDDGNTIAGFVHAGDADAFVHAVGIMLAASKGET